MKKPIIAAAACLCALAASAQSLGTTMGDVFRAMPDSILPSLTQNNRLDLLDFREAKMVATVADRLDTQVTLDTLTADFLDLRLGKTVDVTMKLLPGESALPDTADCLVLVVHGYGEEPMESEARLYTSKWHPVELPAIVTEELKRQLVARPDTMPEEEYARIVATMPDMMVGITLSPDADTAVLMPRFPLLTSDEKERMKAVSVPKVLKWNGKTFK